MRSLCTIGLTILILSGNLAMAQNNQLFTNILSQYVKNGLVDYKNLKNDKRLNVYLAQLSHTDPQKLNRIEKLAFWINAYNAFTLQVIIINYPVKSITDLNTGGRIIGYLLGKSVWDKEFIIKNKKIYSLNDIEHKILRKMSEPRIHFAIVCASISCPPLRNEAYEPNKIDAQLTSQAEIFINDTSRNYFDLKKRRAYLSKIFSWFSQDFGKTDENVLKFISKYLPNTISNDIKDNLAKWNISYKNYNWNLNEQK